jgi:hypothetical protein
MHRTFAAASVALAIAVAPALADDDPWDKGSQWLTVRAGYAKASARATGNALVGYGFGYQRMLNKRWALGVFAHHEALGRFGAATEIEVPLTVELTRHYNWDTSLRPYLGFGAGAFYHKTYRTGDDGDDIRPGGTFNTGANAVVGDRHMVGLDMRLAVVKGGEGDNPVFGPQDESQIHYSIKLGWLLTY